MISEPPPVVSVVLPTYNRARFVGEAISSALAQTASSLEVLVVDDGSRDETPAVVQALAGSDARVRYFRQENQGVSAARNRALDNARGEFIAFLDSDDVWQPWKLDVQLSLLRTHPQVGMTWTNMDAVHPDGTLRESNFLKQMYSAYKHLPTGSPFQSLVPLEQVVPHPDPQWKAADVGIGHIYAPMFHGNLVHTPTVLLRREWAQRVGPFDTSVRRGGEDFKYHLATCRLGNVAFIDVPSILYRTGIGDHITNRENNLYFARSFLATLQNELRQHRDQLPLSDAQINAILADAHDWLSQEQCSAGERGEAFQHALTAIWLRRNPRRSWKLLVKSMLPGFVTRMLATLKSGNGAGSRPVAEVSRQTSA